jgi:hypothetical protein
VSMRYTTVPRDAQIRQLLARHPIACLALLGLGYPPSFSTLHFAIRYRQMREVASDALLAPHGGP